MHDIQELSSHLRAANDNLDKALRLQARARRFLLLSIAFLALTCICMSLWILRLW